MKVTPQFYSMATTPTLQINPQAIEKNILTYSKRCLPIEKNPSVEKGFIKEVNDDPLTINHAFRFYGVGKIIEKPI